MRIDLRVNGTYMSVDVAADSRLLDVLRIPSG